MSSLTASPRAIGPGRLSILFLEGVAASFAGEPVTVRVVDDLDANGCAYSEDNRYRVDIWAGLGIGDTVVCFWHELGHICLHVKHGRHAGTPFGPGREYWATRADDASLSESDRAFAGEVVSGLDEREAQAWTFARNELTAWERKHGFFARAAYSDYATPNQV